MLAPFSSSSLLSWVHTGHVRKHFSTKWRCNAMLSFRIFADPLSVVDVTSLDPQQIHQGLQVPAGRCRSDSLVTSLLPLIPCAVLCLLYSQPLLRSKGERLLPNHWRELVEVVRFIARRWATVQLTQLWVKKLILDFFVMKWFSEVGLSDMLSLWAKVLEGLLCI